jgi:Secretion system C-terminal sorting domain
MRRAILIFLVSMGSFSIAVSQDYYPLQVGDEWRYETRSFYDITRWSVQVIGDTVMPNGKRYAVLNRADVLRGGRFVRADSANIYYYLTQNSTEVQQFRLNRPFGETWTVQTILGTTRFRVRRLDTASFFGTSVMQQQFDVFPPGVESEFSVWIAPQFGPVRHYFYNYPVLAEGIDTRLIGCKIGGITYGNLSAPFVQTTAPKEFALDQNYPNPFNPATVISYQVSSVSEVKLEVFDVLGRSVQTLVSAKQRAGVYRVTFNAASLASGVYFYKLQAGSFSETKKMLLVK